MPNHCDVLGKSPSSGNKVSHSNVKTKRTFRVNAHKKRFWLPSERRWISLNVSTKGLRTIQKRGIESVVASLRSQGKRI